MTTTTLMECPNCDKQTEVKKTVYTGQDPGSSRKGTIQCSICKTELYI